MHWKVKALSGVIAINFILLAGIGMALWLTRPGSDDDAGKDSPDARQATPPPAEVPPLPAPEDPPAIQP